MLLKVVHVFFIITIFLSSKCYYDNMHFTVLIAAFIISFLDFSTVSLPDDIPIPANPVTAFYHGCMEITVGGLQLDFDEALGKHNSIKSHSCPPVSAQDSDPDALHPDME